MFQIVRDGVRKIARSDLILTRPLLHRKASITSAIARGTRKSSESIFGIGGSHKTKGRRSTDLRGTDFKDADESRVVQRRASVADRTPERRPSLRIPGRPLPLFRTPSLVKTSKARISRLDYELPQRGRSRSAVRTEKRRVAREVISYEAPATTPYTTAGSEFLYGTFAVRAALESGRRKFFNLYVWASDDAQREDDGRASILKLAKQRGIVPRKVAGTWDKMLSRMTRDRPHNGLVLETSPLPFLPILSLLGMDRRDRELKVEYSPQSVDEGALNQIFQGKGNEKIIPRAASDNRYPLLLWLDRITDTGNLGAIIRTAAFLGIDAVLIPEHGTAPFSPVTIKASAGAAEHLPVLIIRNESKFMKASQENGWRFFAAVSPHSLSTHQRRLKAHLHEHQALDHAPAVLMVGNEGEGLRPFLQNLADASVSITGNSGLASGIESLNVSVATALLAARFLTKATGFDKVDENSVIQLDQDTVHHKEELLF